jgi:hypothetical protein
MRDPLRLGDGLFWFWFWFCFGNRTERQPCDVAGASLIGGVEGVQGFDAALTDTQPHWARGVAREDIHHTASDGNIAGGVNMFLEPIAKASQPNAQGFLGHRAARPEFNDGVIPA